MIPVLALDNFPRARRYREFFGRHWVQETPCSACAPHFNERHLQCVWYDGRYRPRSLSTLAGEVVKVIDPGRWNLEAGPDFLDAEFVLGSAGKRIRGDVEIHVHPDDWVRHGHERDPRYAAVVAHVTYWPGPLAVGCLPPNTLEISLQEPLAHAGDWWLGDIDPEGYPYSVDAPAGSRLHSGWQSADIDTRLDWLRGAGEERLRCKAMRLSYLMAHTDPGQVFYAEWMAALGYKQNADRFRKLAEVVPLSSIRTIAGNDVFVAAALLLGTAGLLPPAPAAQWVMEARHLHRRLWDHWFKIQGLVAGEVLDRKAWNLSGVRPLNHPVRRLAAAANLAVHCPDVYSEICKLLENPSSDGFQNLAAVFNVQDHMNFWNYHLGFGSRRTERPFSLVGADRRAALVTNVCIPWLLARGCHPQAVFDVVPAEAGNAGIRYAAQVLFGRDHNPAIYRNGLLQQGLLQFFEDCCASP